jgi:hypothetical protein
MPDGTDLPRCRGNRHRLALPASHPGDSSRQVPALAVRSGPRTSATSPSRKTADACRVRPERSMPRGSVPTTAPPRPRLPRLRDPSPVVESERLRPAAGRWSLRPHVHHGVEDDEGTQEYPQGAAATYDRQCSQPNGHAHKTDDLQLDAAGAFHQDHVQDETDDQEHVRESSLTSRSDISSDEIVFRHVRVRISSSHIRPGSSA